MLSLIKPEDFSSAPISVAWCLIHRFENKVLQVLLLQQVKWKQLWGFPGGKIHEWETFFDGMYREVSEETGLLLPKENIEHLNTYYVRNDFGDFLYALYATQFSASSICLNPKEHKDFSWFSHAKSCKIDTIPYTTDCIETFESSL